MRTAGEAVGSVTSVWVMSMNCWVLCRPNVNLRRRHCPDTDHRSVSPGGMVYGAVNPMCQWVPSQNGLLDDPPQRHRVWRFLGS